MKKILFALLVVSLTASFVYAEQSAQTYTGSDKISYKELQVFATFYNNSSTAISSNHVVILDTTVATVASGSALGAYITSTATANSNLVVGVTDETIAAGDVGRVCVRGPHKLALTAAPAALGASIGTGTTAGYGTATTAASAAFGKALSILPTGQGDGQAGNYGKEVGEGNSNYYVWIGGAAGIA